MNKQKLDKQQFPVGLAMAALVLPLTSSPCTQNKGTHFGSEYVYLMPQMQSTDNISTALMSDEAKFLILEDFSRQLLSDMQGPDPEIEDIVSHHYAELL